MSTSPRRLAVIGALSLALLGGGVTIAAAMSSQDPPPPPGLGKNGILNPDKLPARIPVVDARGVIVGTIDRAKLLAPPAQLPPPGDARREANPRGSDTPVPAPPIRYSPR